MKMRQHIYNAWLAHHRRIEIGLLVANLIAIPLFIGLYFLGYIPHLPFGGISDECGTGPYKWPC